MTTLDLITAAIASPIRAPWCLKERTDAIGVLIENGDLAKAAAAIDNAAAQRGLTIAEICRVAHDDREAVFARGEPKPNPT